MYTYDFKRRPKMKIYYISILEQYYQNTDNLFGKDLYTKTESDGKF